MVQKIVLYDVESVCVVRPQIINTRAIQVMVAISTHSTTGFKMKAEMDWTQSPRGWPTNVSSDSENDLPFTGFFSCLDISESLVL